MAGDVSNKTLAILVGVAIVVSVIGVFIGEPGKLTGMQQANATGYAAAIVQSDIQLTMVDNTIWLGNLRPLDRNSSEASESKDNLTINNSGRTTVDVRYWGNESIWTYDCGGTDTANQSDTTSNCYQMRVMGNTSGAVQGSYTAYQNTILQYGNATSLLTDLLSEGVFTVGVNVTVPRYQPSGYSKNVSLWFEASES
jgi:hypothetical protein